MAMLAAQQFLLLRHAYPAIRVALDHQASWSPFYAMVTHSD